MHKKFERYAVYFAPQQDTKLSEFGRQWLSSPGTSEILYRRPDHFVKAPIRYGFHATLKAPMRLAEGVSFDDVKSHVNDLCSRCKPIELGQLRLARLGKFLALIVESDRQDPISTLAWTCVTELDYLRAPLLSEEREKRGNLSPIERDYLEKWGYPYVGKSFRFHMTLTSSLSERELNDAQKMLQPLIPKENSWIDSICIFGDPGNSKQFELVERFDLTGEALTQ